MQHSLFEPQQIVLTPPQGLNGPAFWIRRIALFKDAQTVLRDVSLRKGVNIIWSPDLSTNENGATPHGSGKSTFCRLIRYCLGERTFASDEQRPLMQHKLQDGFVGAEIMIDDECWVVTRPIGMNVPSRAVKADRIEDTFTNLLVATDPPTIASIISDRFCANYRDQVPENLSSDQVWDVVLAWLTRDQECRLDDVLDWRSKRSSSGSPAQELSNDTKLAVVRLALGALSANEITAAAKIRNLTSEREDLKQLLQRLDWLRKEQFQELAGELSLPNDRDPSDATVRRELIDKAKEALAKITGAPHTQGQTSGTDLQSKRQSVQKKRNDAFQELADAQAILKTLPDQISAARGETGTEQARLESGTVVRCSICHVPIDMVKAEGCGISLQQCDLEAVKTRIEASGQKIAEMEAQQTALPATIKDFELKIAKFDLELEQIEAEFRRREDQLSKVSAEDEDARELVRRANSFDQKMVDRSKTAAELQKVETKIVGLQESVKREREMARAAIGDLETLFQQLVAGLMPNGYTGKIQLDGNGLDPQIIPQRGASLSTAAVESFKIVMFDLAAMILAVNGRAKLPSLLIHDSPREADLDARIYSNLFDFALELEGKASPPPFQYIVTTTTGPSQGAKDTDAIVLELSSTPSSLRLFAMDF